MYALDDARILRIVKTEPLDYYERRAAFSDEIAGLPFAIPRLLDSGTVGACSYTIEERIPGRSLDVVLPTLEGARREQALLSYADASLALGRADFDRPWFGEVLARDWQRDTWPEYLIARAATQYERAGSRLRDDAPGADERYRWFIDTVSSLGAIPSGLVHGDFFPANVMVDDDLNVTAAIDFGFSTLHGDVRMDPIGAVGFLEVERPWNRPGDAATVEAYLLDQEPSLAEVADLYRTYYAIFFAFTHEFHLPLYNWCAAVLSG